MGMRGGPSRRIVANPLGGILRDVDRRTRSTTRRRGTPTQTAPVEAAEEQPVRRRPRRRPRSWRPTRTGGCRGRSPASSPGRRCCRRCPPVTGRSWPSPRRSRPAARWCGCGRRRAARPGRGCWCTSGPPRRARPRIRSAAGCGPGRRFPVREVPRVQGLCVLRLLHRERRRRAVPQAGHDGAAADPHLRQPGDVPVQQGHVPLARPRPGRGAGRRWRVGRRGRRRQPVRFPGLAARAAATPCRC